MKNWHLLIVEDDPDGREVISRILTHHKITHDLAISGEDGLELIAEKGVGYTLCVVDLDLPQINGWGLLEFIKNNEATAGLPFIAVTAYDTPEVAISALESGFLSYYA